MTEKQSDAFEVSLDVDGEKVGLNEFASSMLSKGVIGLVSALRGVDDPKQISLNIRVSSEE